MHSTIQDQGIHMHLLHKKCGSRVPNQMMCPVCKVVEERADLVCGFELSKGNYVQITVRSWKASMPRPTARLNSASSCRSTSLIPFILRAAITLKGAEKPYRLLAETLEKTSRVAIAQTVLHEKESLVIVRSVRKDLVTHFMYFANEVRDFDQIPKAEARRFQSSKWIGRGACTARWSVDNVLAAMKPADNQPTQQQGLRAPEQSEPARVSDRKEKPINPN